MKDDYIRLIISDVHLGSFYSKEDELLKFLKDVEFDELILAGDIIDFIKVPKFTEKTIEIFDYISGLDKKIIYVVGNHDNAFERFIGLKFSNIEFKSKYEFEYGNRLYRIQHGDQYDGGIIHWPFLMKMISICHDWLERYFKKNLAALLVRFFVKKKKLKRVWDIVEWNNDVDVFIMGHTHIPEVVIWVDENENIRTYANTGDWVEHSTYVILKGNQLRLKKFNPSQSEQLDSPKRQ
jgi:UDP-2,3-diacylglucosamine pyrophosphatase LpxH